MSERMRNNNDINEQSLLNQGETGKLCVRNPTLVLGLGGTGATFARAVKRKMQGCDNSQMFRVLVIDTDVEERKDLDKNEFFHVEMSYVEAALQKPELALNKYLLEQIGAIQDGRLNTRLQDELITILKHGTFQGAAHVRPLGFMAGGGGFQRIYRQVKSLTDYLTGLNPTINQEGNENYQLSVFIAASFYGGTGSSTFLRILSMICNMKQNVNLSLINFLPTFVDTFEKRDWYQKRSYANSYAAARELDYVHQNAAKKVLNFQLGLRELPLNIGQVKINYSFLVDHYNMQGNAIELKQAIDAAAVHVAAMIGTPIGSEFASRERDNQYLSRSKRDEETGEDCVFSSFGAIALTIPVEELSRYILNRGRETCCSIILGEVPDATKIKQIKEKAENVLNSTTISGVGQAGKRLVLDSRSFTEVIASDLRQRKTQFFKIVPSPLAKVDREFLNDITQRTRPGAAEELLEKTKTDLNNAFVHLKTTLVNSAFIEGDHPAGLSVTRLFLTSLMELLKARKEEQEKQLDELSKTRSRCERDLGERKKNINKFFGKEKERRRYVDTCFLLLENHLNREIGELIISNIALLYDEIDNLIKRIDESVRRTRDCMTQASRDAEQILAEVSGDKILLSSAEINLFVRDDFTEFFDLHLSELKTNLYDMTPADLQNFCLTFFDSEKQQEAEECICKTYKKYISELNIVTYLCNGLKPGWARRDLLTKRLERTFQICSALWSIQSGYDQYFDRMTVCGVPYEGEELPRDFMNYVDKAIGSFNDITYVQTYVKTKIYVVTRIHGGTLKYLSCWPDMKRCYVDWLTSKTIQPPVHIFSSEIIKESERALKSVCTDHFSSDCLEDDFFSSPYITKEEELEQSQSNKSGREDRWRTLPQKNEITEFDRRDEKKEENGNEGETDDVVDNVAGNTDNNCDDGADDNDYDNDFRLNPEVSHDDTNEDGQSEDQI